MRVALAHYVGGDLSLRGGKPHAHSLASEEKHDLSGAA